MKNLTLSQLESLIGGIIVALFMVVGSLIFIYRQIEGENFPEEKTRRFKFFSLVAVIGAYFFGSFFAYHVAVNKGKSDNDAHISGIYSWASVAVAFAEHMQSNKDIPISVALDQFKVLLSPPSKPTLP